MEELKIYNDYDQLGYFEILLNEYTIKLFYEGLDNKDKEDIKDNLAILTTLRSDAYWDYFNYKRLNSRFLQDEKYKDEIFFYILCRKSYFDKVESLKNSFELLYYQLNKYLQPKYLSHYLRDNCSLLHLVSTNNECSEIHLYSEDSFMFSCQFHNERTPSLGISNCLGLGHCFGCGTSFNLIDYLKEYENIEFHETLSLLLRIYLIDIKNNLLKENDPRVLKYQKHLLSPKFKELVMKGYTRSLQRKEKHEMPCNELALKKYESLLNTIERVKNGQHENFNNLDKPQKLVLKMPIFDKY